MSPQDSSSGGVVVKKPKSNVYTMMLFLSLVAILLAILCLYLEMEAYNWDIKATEAQVRPGGPVSWLDPGWGRDLRVALAEDCAVVQGNSKVRWASEPVACGF